MKVLQLHNRYVQLGGEDTVLDLEYDLLRQRGHFVKQFLVSNETLQASSFTASMKAGLNSIWSQRSNRALKRLLDEEEPDILHVHNTFPQLSPSVYWTATKLGVPVVQTLHNYRITCTNGLLMRDGHPCELCVGHAPFPALKYRCYRDSLPATGAVAGMLTVHRTLGTYSNKVNAYITMTEFAKSIFTRSGLPQDRVYVKPNFMADTLSTLDPLPERSNQVVFVGRMVSEKGVDLLLQAWKKLGPSDARLILVGDGPEREDLQRRFYGLPGVVWRGWLDGNDKLREVARSRWLVMASRWYEEAPMVLIEALSVGTPVIAPNYAGLPEIVTPGSNGLLFAPGSAKDLAKVLNRVLRIDAAVWQSWSANSRDTYSARYTPEANYHQLMNIYRRASEHARSRACN